MSVNYGGGGEHHATHLMAAASTGFTKPKLCFLIASLIFIPLAKAYLLMPVVILYAKMVPHSIEGLMIGLIKSIVAFNTEILMRLVGLLYLINKDIDFYTYHGMFRAVMFSLIQVSLIPIVIFTFRIKREDAMEVQVIIKHLDEVQDNGYKADSEWQRTFTEVDVIREPTSLGASSTTEFLQLVKA